MRVVLLATLVLSSGCVIGFEESSDTMALELPVVPDDTETILLSAYDGATCTSGGPFAVGGVALEEMDGVALDYSGGNTEARTIAIRVGTWVFEAVAADSTGTVIGGGCAEGTIDEGETLRLPIEILELP